MDAIEALDDGAYAHFSFVANENPGILRYMQPAFFVAKHMGTLTHFGTLLLLLTIVFLFVTKRKLRSAWIAMISVAAAIVLINVAHRIVTRPRPQEALQWLGPLAQSGSYPSDSVFLFTLSMILLGNAAWAYLTGLWARALFIIGAAATTVWVCMSQFFFGIQYVTDVIGAVAGAALLGWVAIKLMAPSSPPLLEASSDAIQDLSRTTAIEPD